MRKHHFKETEIEHFDDGTGTVHHIHEKDPSRDVKHAFGDLDELHDSLQEHLNPEEAEKSVEAKGLDPETLEEVVHPGIHSEVAALAGAKE